MFLSSFLYVGVSGVSARYLLLVGGFLLFLSEFLFGCSFGCLVSRVSGGLFFFLLIVSLLVAVSCAGVLLFVFCCSVFLLVSWWWCSGDGVSISVVFLRASIVVLVGDVVV